MLKKLMPVALAAATLSATASFADGLDKSMFSIKGFGTVGVVHSSEDQADFVGSVFQPNGAGRTRDWDASVDSKLGVQATANFSDRFSAVVQAVSQHQYDNTWRPLIEWANIKYQITPELSVRLGRIVLPTFLISDSRMVGYANPWIRPPEEIYFNSPITNSDGGDFTYRKQFGSVVNTTQAFYGSKQVKVPPTTIKAKPDWGINDTVEIDALTLRASYVSLKLDIVEDNLDTYYDIVNQFGADAAAAGNSTAAAQAAAIANKYSPDGIHINIYTVGANYDPGEWFAMGEFAKVVGDSFLTGSKSFYVTTGYRIAQFTPYITFAQIKSDSASGNTISTAGLPADLAARATTISAITDSLLSAFQASQRTASVGVRWDFMANADFKVQYERKNMLDDTNGRLINAAGTFQGGGDFNVISAAVDFVF